MSGVNSGSAPDVHRNNNKNFLVAERRSSKHCQTGVSFTIPGNMWPSINETTLKLTDKKDRKKVRRNK